MKQFDISEQLALYERERLVDQSMCYTEARVLKQEFDQGVTKEEQLEIIQFIQAEGIQGRRVLKRDFVSVCGVCECV